MADSTFRIVPRLYRVILPVGDVERAAAVYAELLGEAGKRVSPGRHYFDCGGTILACYESQADGDGPAEPPRYQPAQFLYFSVVDLEATHKAAVRLGFKVQEGGIQSMPGASACFGRPTRSEIRSASSPPERSSSAGSGGRPHAGCHGRRPCFSERVLAPRATAP